MTDKPEVNCHEAQYWTPDAPVVHKLDYDALAAQSAADKARIAELEQRPTQNAYDSVCAGICSLREQNDELLELLRDIGHGCSRRDMPCEATIAEWSDRIDATLAKLGGGS